jgi:hypothetical protein
MTVRQAKIVLPANVTQRRSARRSVAGGVRGDAARRTRGSRPTTDRRPAALQTRGTHDQAANSGGVG